MLEKQIVEAFWVYVTATDKAEAGTLARAVVGERLAACANFLGPVESVYWWDGKLCEDEEVALILKTSGDRKNDLITRIHELHSYEIPCIVCLPITDGNPDFLQWIATETALQN